LGAKNTLTYIKNLGFKTFDTWIDESYDTLETFADRSESAVNQLDRWCNMHKLELQDVCEEMQETLEYNFNHYINGFGKHDLDLLLQNMLNLKE
jgi:hypothetical protein